MFGKPQSSQLVKKLRPARRAATAVTAHSGPGSAGPARLVRPVALAGLLLGCALFGCAGPGLEQERPAVPAAPALWPVSLPAGAADPVSQAWWQAFGSPELAGLVARAEARSFAVAAAVARVRQAEADVRIAGAALLPQLSASVTASRVGRLGGSAEVAGTTAGAGLTVGYEADIWGRLAAGRRAAGANWEAGRFDLEAVRLVVAAGVASAWIQTVAARERTAIGERHLHDASRLLALVESRARAGAASPLEVAQQRALVAAQTGSVAALRQLADEAATATRVLLGETGGDPVATASLAGLQVPAIDPGLPATLLVRRPDLARAEAGLRAAEADVQAARVAMLPAVSLTGGLGTGGDALRRVLADPIYSLAAALTAPIFDGGRLAARRDRSEATRETVLADYHAAVVAAFGDVAAALAAVSGTQAQALAQAEELEQARRALRLAESRYRAGAESLLTLLDTQRTLYAAEDGQARLGAGRMLAAIALYRALGGGWSRTEVSVVSPDPSRTAL